MKWIIQFFKSGVPFLYGVSWVLGSVASFISIFVYLFKVFQGEREFEWVIPIFMLIFTAVFSFGGYLLLKVAEQEYSKSKKY